MKEFRPQQMASRPIFMIAFTFMAVVYSGWMAYDYFALGSDVNWSSVVFILAVIGMLWYSRFTGAFYVKVHKDILEWKVTRSESHLIEAKDVTTIGVNKLSIDFMTSKGMVELSLANFDRGTSAEDVINAIVEWGKSHSIHIEQD